MQAQQDTSTPSLLVKLIPIGLFLIGFSLSLFVWHTTVSEQQREMRAAFNYESDKLLAQLVDNLKKQEAIIANLRGFYKNYVQVVRDVFELYTSFPTILTPGVQAIYYSPKVYNTDVERFTLYARMEGYLGYTIRPDGIRDFYFPVLYVVPVRKNEVALGYDVYTDKTRYDAITAAIRLDTIIATRKTQLVSLNDSGFVLVAPIYYAGMPHAGDSARKANLQGIVSVEVESDGFFNAVAKSGGTERYVEIEVYSDTGKSAASCLFSSKTNNDPVMASEMPITFGGETFLLALSSSRRFEHINQSDYPHIILVEGIVISILLAMCAFLLLVHTSLLTYFRKHTGQP